MTTGMDAHPEVSEISDFSEGLLPPERSTAVQAHLDDCDLCRDVLHSLEEIRGLLGTLPGPKRMPADIAGRIDAALAAEALLDATLPAVPRETSDSAERPSGVPRETSTAPSGHPGGPSGPGRGGRSGGRTSGSRRRRGFLAVAMAAATALLGGVIYAAASGSGGQAASNAAGLDTASQKSVAGNPDTVRDRVRELLAASSATSGATEKPGATDRGNTPMLHQDTTGTAGQPKMSPAAVPPCVLKATHRSQPPLAADRELFAGTESYLVVLPHPNDTARVDAFVVNASCTPSSPGAVLFQGTYPR